MDLHPGVDATSRIHRTVQRGQQGWRYSHFVCSGTFGPIGIASGTDCKTYIFKRCTRKQKRLLRVYCALGLQSRHVYFPHTFGFQPHMCIDINILLHLSWRTVFMPWSASTSHIPTLFLSLKILSSLLSFTTVHSFISVITLSACITFTNTFIIVIIITSSVTKTTILATIVILQTVA